MTRIGEERSDEYVNMPDKHVLNNKDVFLVTIVLLMQC